MAGTLLHTQNERVRAGLIADEMRAGKFQRNANSLVW